MDFPQQGDLHHPPATADISPDPSNRPAKRRWRRNRIACDSCHSRRVRCDRIFPCSRCMRSDIHCEFTRERRKRGRIARSRQPASSTENAANPSGPTMASFATESVPAASPAQKVSPASTLHQRSPTTNGLDVPVAPSINESRSAMDGPSAPSTTRSRAGVMEEWLSATNMSPHSYGPLGGAGWGDGPPPRMLDIWNGFDATGDNVPTPPSPRTPGMGQRQAKTTPTLKYPVLQPVMPFLESNIPRRLVFDLLELYFTSQFSTHMHPVCHHIHCYVLRKASFLTQDHPRPSSPALLASMLWVAALDDRAFALSISPPQRKRICQFLCALTIGLLRPLIHVSFKDQGAASGGAYSAVGQEYPVGVAHHPFEAGGDDRGLVGPAGSLDDVITYIHVASIISASEQKAASMRWSAFCHTMLMEQTTDLSQVACGLHSS